jgi:hypothetical protein
MVLHGGGPQALEDAQNALETLRQEASHEANRSAKYRRALSDIDDLILWARNSPSATKARSASHSTFRCAPLVVMHGYPTLFLIYCCVRMNSALLVEYEEHDRSLRSSSGSLCPLVLRSCGYSFFCENWIFGKNAEKYRPGTCVWMLARSSLKSGPDPGIYVGNSCRVPRAPSPAMPSPSQSTSMGATVSQNSFGLRKPRPKDMYPLTVKVDNPAYMSPTACFSPAASVGESAFASACESQGR